MSSVEMRPIKDTITGNLYDVHLENFAYYGIYSLFGISFDEYISRPRYEIDSLNKVAKKRMEVKNKAQKDIHSELEDLKGGFDDIK